MIDQYLAKEPDTNYSNHWIFSAIESGRNVFTKPDISRAAEVEYCQEQIIGICDNFTFRNNELVYEIFDDIPKALEQANILLTVGMPSIYDATVKEHQGEFYMIFDLINFANYGTKGVNLPDLINGLLSHELSHVLINDKYPPKEFSYVEQLNYISFHEGFAHLLSYKEDITNYQPDETVYKAHFDNAKEKLLAALEEKDPILRQKYQIKVNTGSYWDKFGAIASKLYLMKHIDALKSIYNEGWNNYTNKIVNYEYH